MRAGIVLRVTTMAITAVVLSSCGKSEMERDFLAACTKQEYSEKVCACSYDGLAEHYGKRRMREFEQGHVPDDFPVVMTDIMAQCEAKQAAPSRGTP